MKKSRIITFAVCVVMLLCMLAITAFAAEQEKFTSGPLEYTVLDDGTVKITKYTGTDKDYVIPSKIDGKKITVIGKLAFSYLGKLENLTIPGCVKELESYAVHSCQALKTVTIEEGLLSSLNLNFEYCTALKRVNIPENIETLAVFMCCDSLEEIIIAEDNPYICDVDGIVFSKDKKTLVRYPHAKKAEKYTVPSSVKKIANNAFYSVDGIESIYVPKTVATVEEHAFAYTSFPIFTDAASAPAAWKSALTGRTVYYNYTLSAFNSVDLNGLKNSEGSSSKLATPVITSSSQSTNAISLYWEAVKGAYDYDLYQYVSGEWKWLNTYFDNVPTSGKMTYRVESLKPGTTYKFRLRASADSLDDDVYSDYSPVFTVATKPLAPKISSTSKSTDAVRLNWGKVTGANGYIVEQYTSGAWKRIATITSPDTLTYRAEKLKSGTTHKFRVKAYKKVSGETFWSGATPTITITTNLTTPKITSTSKSTNAVGLNWGKVTGANGYIVEQYTSGAWKRIATITSPDTITYRAEKLKSGTTYKFRVKAYKKVSGETLWSGATPTLTITTNPATPKITSTSKSTNAVRINWGKVTGANGYIVEQYTSGAWKRIATITKADTVTYRAEKLKSGTTHKFRVKAYKKVSGETVWSGATPTLTITTNLTAPKITSISQTTNAIRLNWGKVTGANGYIVEQYTSGAWKRIATITKPDTVTYRAEKLKSGTTYKFRVKAYKKVSGETLWSDATSTITTATKPGKTTVTLKSEGPGQLTLEWKAVTGADTYSVYYKVNGGEYKHYKTYTSAQKITFKNLKGGDNYTIAVKAGKTVSGKTLWGDSCAKSAKVTYRTTRYLNAIKSGTYYVKYYVNGVEFAEAIKGDKLYTIIYDDSGNQYRVVYNGSQKKWYYINDQYKFYTTVNDSDLPAESRGSETIKAIKNQEIPTSFKSTKEGIYQDLLYDEALFCETATVNGISTKYCYQGTKLVMILTDLGNGTEIEQFIDEFTNKVPDSLFTLSADYEYVA